MSSVCWLTDYSEDNGAHVVVMIIKKTTAKLKMCHFNLLLATFSWILFCLSCVSLQNENPFRAASVQVFYSLHTTQTIDLRKATFCCQGKVSPHHTG